VGVWRGGVGEALPVVGEPGVDPEFRRPARRVLAGRQRPLVIAEAASIAAALAVVNRVNPSAILIDVNS
jgi:hypothetical protein